MFRHTIQLLLVTCLASGTVSEANEPFVGEWKLDPSKSKLTDQMKVESVAGNKYAFDFGGGSARQHDLVHHHLGARLLEGGLQARGPDSSDGLLEALERCQYAHR